MKFSKLCSREEEKNEKKSPTRVGNAGLVRVDVHRVRTGFRGVGTLGVDADRGHNFTGALESRMAVLRHRPCWALNDAPLRSDLKVKIHTENNQDVKLLIGTHCTLIFDMKKKWFFFGVPFV